MAAGPVMAGSIGRVSRERVERRDDARLPSAWIGDAGHADGIVGTGSVTDLSWLQRDAHHEPAAADHDSPVLAMLASPSSSAAMADLLAHGEAGARVYVLVPAGWGKGATGGAMEGATHERLLTCAKVLLRRVPEVPATGVHRAGGAWIWLGSEPGGPAPWRLRLTPAQAASFRQVFLRSFWHEATEEAWTGTRQLAFRAAGARPFDVPELPRSAPVRLAPPDATLERDPRGCLLHLVSGSPPGAAPRRLWYPAGGAHHDRLARHVRDGAEVVCGDLALPDLAIGRDGGEALLPGRRARLRIALTAEQAADVAHILEQPAAWRFQVDVRLGDHARAGARLWLAGEADAHPIEAEQVLELPDIPTDALRDALEAQPARWPAARALALVARYRWRVIPPRVPPGAGADPLIDRWRRLDDEWAARLAALREALEASETSRGRIRQRFARLVGAMLGFERTGSGLREEISTLDARPPSAAGPADAPALFTTLAALEERARQLRSELEDTERKAHEEEEREKQRGAWRSRVEAAQRDLPAARRALADAQRRRSELAAALDQTEAAFRDAAKAKTKDLEAQRAKYSDERARQEQRIRRLEGELADLEQRAAEVFSFDAPAAEAPTMHGRARRGAGRFVPSTAAARPEITVPEDALPQIGSLRTHRGQRYLVIERWEELERGEHEAARLGARLVAPERA